jgi:hypothetical protein
VEKKNRGRKMEETIIKCERKKGKEKEKLRKKGVKMGQMGKCLENRKESKDSFLMWSSSG